MHASRTFFVILGAFALSLTLTVPAAHSADWPQLGRDCTRNAVSPEKGAPLHWQVEERDRDGKLVRAGRNIRWTAELGSATGAGPTVAGGLVWVGTNNIRPRDPAVNGDVAVLMCFRESDGQFLWQYTSSRLPARDNDWPQAGINCSPLAEGDRLYFTTNRAEVVCLDISPLRKGTGTPQELWKLDMVKQLGVFPSGSPMSRGSICSISASINGRICVSTGNGVPHGRLKAPAPKAPSLTCLEAATGKVLWQDSSPGAGILDGQWSSPLVVPVKDRVQVIAAQSDGWVRSFDLMTGKLVWKFDANPKSAVYKWSPQGTRNYFLATPVYHDGRVYIGTGQHPMHRPGVGRFWCIDPTREGDVSAELKEKPGKGKLNPNSAALWCFDRWEDSEGEKRDELRTVANVTVHDGLVIAPTLGGDVHCLDAKTGKRYWTHEMRDHVHASPLVVDGKVYVVDERGEVAVLALAREKKLLAVNRMSAKGVIRLRAGPVFANGVLYIATHWRLYAIRTDKEESPRAGHWPQWRGSDRLNISSDKTLLDTWPKDGPPLLWQVNGIGEGVGTVTVAAGKVYVLGHRDKYEHLTAMEEATGKPLWSMPLGESFKEYDPMRWLSQRTPLVDDGRIYAVTARGELVCVRAATGKRLWRKSYPKDFEGRRGVFGVCDQLLVDGDRLICVPGGKSATVVALDKRTGEPIWKCPLGDSAAYVGAVLAGGPGEKKHYVAVTHLGLVGVSTEGKLLWRHERLGRNTALSCTPNVLGNRLFWAANYGRGVVLLELNDTADGVEAKEIYLQKLSTPSWHEMVICLGDHAYVGTNTGLFCLELKSGEIVWKDTPGAVKGSRSLYSGTCADGHLYLRTQHGTVLLVEASPKAHIIKGSFQIPDTKSRPGSTAPVVTGGRLYLRDHDRLLCYDVRKGSKPGRTVVHTTPPPATSEGGPPPITRERGPDAIYVPTPHDVVEKMLELAAVKKTETLVDLGCGDGRIVVAAAKKYGCKAIGYEIDPECIKMARANVRKHGVGESVTIEQKDFFTVNLSKVDVVALYLPPKVLSRLLPQLERLPRGARIVSHAFAIPGIVAERTVSVTAKEDGLERKLYSYSLPLKRTKDE
jgi:outer membrane protein assembly factor BamB